MNYYISDLHFGHQSVIPFDGRPFATVEEMDRTLIEKWNAKVSETDDVWILGDFLLLPIRMPEYYLKQLKGRLHFIIGNHDQSILKSEEALAYFESVERIQQIRDGDFSITLCHYPLAEWEGLQNGAYHIYGHIHGSTGDTYEFMRTRPQALNAGCMINNYEPVTLAELIENNRKFQMRGESV